MLSFFSNNKLLKLLNNKHSERLREEIAERKLQRSERSLCGSQRPPVVGVGNCWIAPRFSAADWLLRLVWGRRS